MEDANPAHLGGRTEEDFQTDYVVLERDLRGRSSEGSVNLAHRHNDKIQHGPGLIWNVFQEHTLLDSEYVAGTRCPTAFHQQHFTCKSDDYCAAVGVLLERSGVRETAT